MCLTKKWWRNNWKGNVHAVEKHHRTKPHCMLFCTKQPVYTYIPSWSRPAIYTTKQHTYSNISIKHTYNYKINLGNNWKIAQIVRKASNLCHKFDAFLINWAIFQLFPKLISCLRASFIEILLYMVKNTLICQFILSN